MRLSAQIRAGLATAGVGKDHALQGFRQVRQRTGTAAPETAGALPIASSYMNPPEHALVLCVDEKSQIQALDRTQPGLPLKRGRAQTMTHDYKRNGTAALFAALNLLDGSVVGQVHLRHRHQEFLRFLRALDRRYPKDLDLHLVLDNYGTHGHPETSAWLSRRPRFHLHFVPTSSSWLNLIEVWFSQLTNRAIRRGSFASLGELVIAIHTYIEAHNDDPKPFVWTATVESILDKVNRCRAISRTAH